MRSLAVLLLSGICLSLAVAEPIQKDVPEKKPEKEKVMAQVRLCQKTLFDFYDQVMARCVKRREAKCVLAIANDQNKRSQFLCKDSIDIAAKDFETSFALSQKSEAEQKTEEKTK